MDDNTTKKVLAANLSRILQEREWSQQDLVEKCSGDKMAISRVMRGTNMPGLGLVTRIAAALEVSVDELLENPKKHRQPA